MSTAPVPPDGENPIRDMNPYRYEGANRMSRAAWDSGYSVGFAAGRAAASSDPPTSWECCGHTFTGTADFISGARSAHVCDIAPEDVPDAETAYAMGKAAATPPAEGSVSYRVRDRDSDYKAMCHENREHAELLLQAWLADGRDAVIESRIVYDDGWRPDAECRAPHCWSEYGTPCATCPKEKR